MRISDWSSDVCSSDLTIGQAHDDAEHVAADTGKHIAFAHGRQQTAGDGRKQFVAGQMTEAVVDAGETVEIRHKYRGFQHRLPVRLRPVEPFGKGDSIGKAGQGVEIGRASWRERVGPAW